MDISTVKELWKPNLRNLKAGMEWWNSKAEKFAEKELPTAENSIAMRIIRQENMVGKGSRTLDVGCGGGRFSFVLEAMGAEATATDFSPEMIRKAMANGKDRRSKVRFSEDNWHTVNLREKNWEKQFDLVLANMTPAVVSADTFLKLSQGSRGWVLMVKPTRRTNWILDELNRRVKAEQDTKALDETIVYAFDLVWSSGGCPKLEYEEQIWQEDQPLEEAIKEYTLRISSTHELAEADKEKIREYLESIADDGIVHEVTNTTLAAMYWHV